MANFLTDHIKNLFFFLDILLLEIGFFQVVMSLHYKIYLDTQHLI